MNEQMEELYKVAKEIFVAEHQRFIRLETKAFSYLTVLTFVIGFSVPLGVKFFGQLIPPTSFSGFLLLNLLIISMVGLVVTWFIAFSAVKVSKTPSLPLNFELVDFFKKNRMIDIHYALSKGYSKEWKKLVAINDRKAHFVTIAHTSILVNVVLLLFIFFLGFVRTWGEIGGNPKATSLPVPVPAVSNTTAAVSFQAHGNAPTNSQPAGPSTNNTKTP
jgi:hypothetical protein